MHDPSNQAIPAHSHTWPINMQSLINLMVDAMTLISLKVIINPFFLCLNPSDRHPTVCDSGNGKLSL